MKKVLLIFMIIFTLFSIYAVDYGTSITIENTLPSEGIAVQAGLIFNPKNVQHYEFGFTQDTSVSFATETNAVSTLPLTRDEEREAADNTNIMIASASFSVYWKVISGYTLRFYLESNGPFSDGNEPSTNTIAYSVLNTADDVILGANRTGYNGENAYTTETLLGTHTPDYVAQNFVSSVRQPFEIVTAEDITNKFISDGSIVSYSTKFTISVEVV